METAYLETTFISYLVALPASSVITAAHQQVTRDWWQRRRSHFRCVVSQVVLDEISAGDAAEVKKRLEMVKTLDVLAASADAEALTAAIVATGVLPEKAIRDAAHICRCNCPRSTISGDVELQAPGERTNYPTHRENLQRTRLPDAYHMHSRGIARGDER